MPARDENAPDDRCAVRNRESQIGILAAGHTLEKRGLDGFDDLPGAWDGKLSEFSRRQPDQLVERAVKAVLAPESGLHREPRTDPLILTIKSGRRHSQPAHVKRGQASANCWHIEIRLDDPKQVDRELKSWLKDAIKLSSPSPSDVRVLRTASRY